MWAEWFLDMEKVIRHKKMQVLELESACVH